MGRYRKYFKIYRKMQEMNIKSLMYYRADFLMMTFFTLLSQVSNLAVIGIIYTNIPTVGGWSVWEILLLYGYLLFSEGWVNFFFQGSWKIAQMVNKSEIDRFLVRPLPAGMQMVASRIDFDGLNKMIIALGILSVGIKNCKINWTIIKILYFVASLLTASMIRFCMIWLASCMSFWMQGPKNSLNYLVLSVGEMAKYPLIIYPCLLKGIFGYIIPYVYVSYYPAGFLLGKKDMLPGCLLLFPVCIGMLWLSAACLKCGLGRYESAGN